MSALPSLDLADTLSACIEHLGAAILPVWGVDTSGHCYCPKGANCKDPGKHPNGKLAPMGYKNATRDMAIIRQWIRSQPHGNWGMATGGPIPSGGFLGVFDWDPRNGAEQSIAELGERGCDLPPTVAAISGGAGGHRVYAFRKQPESRCLGPGLDLVGHGKMVVVAPSHHKSGGTYAWEMLAGPGDIVVAAAPEWMERETLEAKNRPDTDGGTAAETVLGEAFRLAMMAGAVQTDGTMYVKCVQAELHSDGRGRGEDSSTVVLPPAGGSRFGGFKCGHGHCANLKWKDVIKLLGPDIMDRAHKKYPRLSVVQNVAPVVTLPDEPDTLQSKIKRFSKQLAFDNTGKGYKLINDSVNLSTILKNDPRWEGILQWDEFGRVLRFTSPPPWHENDAPRGMVQNVWSDADEMRMTLWFLRTWGIKVKGSEARDIAHVVAFRNTYNPLKDYLNALVWDGISRLDSWLPRYVGCKDDAYHRSAGRKWALSAVARALDPGCKADSLIVLEGAQGALKSTLLRSLCPDPLWFSDTPFDIGSKDAFQSLNGKWIIEIAELASLKKADLDRAKAFFSAPSDYYRPSYGRTNITAPRTCIFAGTVNLGQYLFDPTGARRFVPVRVGTIDIEGVHEDRDQLWAEAVQVYKLWKGRGSPQHECLWWPSRDEVSTYSEEQNKRTVRDPRIDILRSHIESSHGKALISKNGGLTMRDIAKFLDIPERDMGVGEATRMGQIMVHELGWVRSRTGYSPR